MKLLYNNFSLDQLGEFTISQSRQYEDGQRVKVTIKVGITTFAGQYADNYSLMQQAQIAFQTMEGVLQWTDSDTNVDYLNQTVSLESSDLPEEWGEYQQQFNIIFWYYEQNLVTNNMPLTISSTGGAAVLGNVAKFAQTSSTDRFSAFHSQRSLVKGEIAVSGFLLVDATQDLETRRTALIAAKTAMDAAFNSKEVTVVYAPSGVAPGEGVFDQVVRPEKYTSDIDELHYQITWSFSASYTVFPNEATFATVEYEAEQRDQNTGEQLLAFHGRIMAATEAIARAKLAALMPVVLAQYGYAVKSQQLRNDSTARQVSANEDGDFFTELNFSQEYKRYRTDNQLATYTKTGNKKAVPLGNVVNWDLAYSGRRFNDMRSQRQHAGGRVTASGCWIGDPTLTLAQQRAALLAQQAAMQAEVNGPDGTLTYGTFTQVCRIEDFQAHVDQSINEIKWSCTAFWSAFPNESGYATCDFTVNQSSNVEDGEQLLSFAGTILAPDEALARAKLASLRTTMLDNYGFTLAQQLKPQATVRSVFANGDKTAGLGAFEESDGTTFIELTFSEEYRQRMATLLGYTMKSSSRTDITTGLVLTTFAGAVQASGATVDAAYRAALAKAQALGSGQETQLGNNAFQRQAQIDWDQRQTQATNSIEFVRLTFSYEYQSKQPVGNAYLEVRTDSDVETFGNDQVSVSGMVIAVDGPTATSLYQSQVKASYTGMIIHSERLSQSQMQNQAPSGAGTFNTQDIRLDFSFTVFVPKAAGTVNYRYSITTSNDYLQLTRQTNIRGSVFAPDQTTAAAAVATLLGGIAPAGASLVTDENGVDSEFTSASGDIAFLKYDFGAAYVSRITGIGNLLEMKVTESIKYSGVRWIVQPIPRNADGTGGVAIPQDGGLEPGSRSVRGMVTAATQAAAVEWARQQRQLLTGDDNGGNFPQPEELETEYEFVPRMDGVADGAGENVRLYRVNFGFSEVLPYYPPTS